MISSIKAICTNTAQGVGKTVSAGAACLLAMACATTDTEQTIHGAHRPATFHSAQYRGNDFPHNVEAIKLRAADMLDMPQLAETSYKSTIVERARIGTSAGVRETAHEYSATLFGESLPGTDKVRNLQPTASLADTVIYAQNTMSNNGGWQEAGESLFHSLSGMYCPKTLEMILQDENGETSIVETSLKSVKIYNEQGTDTSCDYQGNTVPVYLTLYASYWPDVTLDQHFSAALKLITDRFQIKEETTVLVASREGDQFKLTEEKGDTLAAAFITEPMSEMTFKTALWLNAASDWHVKARATFPVVMKDNVPQLSVVELVSATYHATTLADVAAHVDKAQTVSY